MLSTILSLAFSCLTIATAPKPRSVIVHKEIKNATVISWVEVLDYQRNELHYKPVEGVVVRPFKVKCPPHRISGSEAPGTGYWPAKGEQVLLILDEDGAISLFAAKQGEDYRLWSPSFTGSLALFQFKAPAKRLPDCEGVEALEGELLTCWDGCLYPIDLMPTKAP